MNKKALLLLSLLLFFTAGCDLINQINGASMATAEPTPVPGATAVSTAVTPPEATPDIAIPATAVTQTRPSLRIWIPPEIAIATDEGAAVFNAQLAGYRSTHPDLDLTVEQKAASGQSGILNYLRTGRTVAPAILPDLIAIPIEQLGPALTEELVFPIDGLVETQQLEELYPAALELVLRNNQVGGYPFVLTGLPHLAYNSQTFTQTIPLRWEPLSALPASFVLPANGNAGGLLALEFYQQAGGTLTNDAGQVALQVEPLATALQQLFIAKNSGFILDQSSNYTSLQESWQFFQAGSATFTLTNSEQFLRLRDEEGNYAITAVPGLQRPLTPLVSGWAWAISTADPARRELAAELMNDLINSSYLGEWSYASSYLPASRAALAIWPQDDPYVAFAADQLSQARAMTFSTSSPLMTALNNAVFDVVTLAKTPQVAAEEAVADLQP